MGDGPYSFRVRREGSRWRVSFEGAVLTFDSMEEAKHSALGACELYWNTHRTPCVVQLELIDQPPQVVAEYGPAPED